MDGGTGLREGLAVKDWPDPDRRAKSGARIALETLIIALVIYLPVRLLIAWL